MKGGGEMNMNLFSKGIWPWLCTGIMLLLFLPLCMKDRSIDYFLLWIIMGFPYGISKLKILIIPKSYGFSGTIGFVVFICIISGIIGGLIWIYKLIVSIWVIISSALSCIIYLLGRKKYGI